MGNLVTKQNTPLSSPLPNIAQTGMEQLEIGMQTDPGNSRYEALFKAVKSGDLKSTKKLVEEDPELVNARITWEGQTALHIASLFEHLHIVEELVQIMSPQDLRLTDEFGHTALHWAVINPTKKSIKVAKYLVQTDPTLVGVSVDDADGWSPILKALDNGNIEMTRYLYFFPQSQAWLFSSPLKGIMFLNMFSDSRLLDLALDVIKKQPELLLAEWKDNFPSFWKKLAAVFPRERPSRQKCGSLVFPKKGRDTRSCTEVIADVARCVLNGRRLEAKLYDEQYIEVVRVACDFISKLNSEEMGKGSVGGALLIAARVGNRDFIVEAIKAKFIFLWTRNRKRKTIFHFAIEHRQESVFNLIHGLITFKNVAANFSDVENNSLLHMAGLLAPPTYLNQITGALLQMQRELQWFKAVEKIVPPAKKESVNRKNLTARELFTAEHMDLVKKGEKWTKGTANSCSVVAALVATITFAAAFTVPGGNDQVHGYPIFLNRKLFLVFAISDAMSLFFSSTSLLMFLGLLTARYAEDDFLTTLPRNLMIGLTTMFISIATMMVAFCAGLFLMLHNHYSWIVFPVTLLAAVPVTLYIFLQFPLLVEIIRSTYFPGIFTTNVEPWS